MRLKQAKSSRGFSLVELLIVVVVIAVLVGGGIASYRRFSDRQQVKKAAEDLVTQLRVVQKKADAGEIPVGCAGKLDSYQVDIASGASSGDIIAVCSIYSVTFTGTIDLQYGTRVGSGGDVSVNFLSLGEGATATTIQVVGSGWCVPVIVSTGGTIKVGTLSAC